MSRLVLLVTILTTRLLVAADKVANRDLVDLVERFERGFTNKAITHADAADTLPRALNRLKERWDLSSLRFSGIRVIAHANLALAGWRIRVETRDNGPIDRHVVVALARTARGWHIVGTPWQDNHNLGLPDSDPSNSNEAEA